MGRQCCIGNLPLEQLVNSAVCKQCNGGWMSSLENAVDPIIEKLNNGTDVLTLSAGEVEILARWSAKDSRCS